MCEIERDIRVMGKRMRSSTYATLDGHVTHYLQDMAVGIPGSLSVAGWVTRIAS